MAEPSSSRAPDLSTAGYDKLDAFKQALDDGDQTAALAIATEVGMAVFPSHRFAAAYRGWGLKGYYAMFASLGFLALSKVAVLHWVGFVGAVVAALVAIYMGVMMWVYRSRYVRACRAEGVEPSWRRR